MEVTERVVGLKPKYLYEEDYKLKSKALRLERFGEVCDAINRYITYGKIIPLAWLNEYNDFIKEFKEEDKCKQK